MVLASSDCTTQTFTALQPSLNNLERITITTDPAHPYHNPILYAVGNGKGQVMKITGAIPGGAPQSATTSGASLDQQAKRRKWEKMHDDEALLRKGVGNPKGFPSGCGNRNAVSMAPAEVFRRGRTG